VANRLNYYSIKVSCKLCQLNLVIDIFRLLYMVLFVDAFCKDYIFLLPTPDWEGSEGRCYLFFYCPIDVLMRRIK
jgi:hypothetical protein